MNASTHCPTCGSENPRWSVPLEGFGSPPCRDPFHSTCPTCGSPAPERHPAVQHEGEVQPCRDPFHLTVTPENTPERIAETQATLKRIFVDAATSLEARLLDDAYREGFTDGLTAYSYTSSEPWAESGVRYVGTTGIKLAEAIEDAEGDHAYSPPSAR